MTRNYLLIYLFVLTRSLFGNAQSYTTTEPIKSENTSTKKPLTPLQRIVLLRDKFRQTAQVNQQLSVQLSALQKINLAQQDTLDSQEDTIDTLTNTISQLTARNKQLQTSLAQQAAELKAFNSHISQLEYDKKILTDNQVFRVYQVPAAEVRQQFMQSLALPGSGFQDDDDLVDDEIQITRQFNGQADVWWDFDKSVDTILELKIRIKPHLYDPQRALVIGQTRLLQKARYSNKPFGEQLDQEKIDLYRQKILRILEGKLNGTSDK